MDPEEFTADEQAQFDAMRDADAQPDASGEGAAAPQPAQPDAGNAAGAADGTPAAPGTPPKEPRPQNVPLASLQEERSLRRAAEQKAQMLEERTNLILQRFATQQPQGQPQPQQPAAPAIPPLADDPVGHMVGTQQEQQRNLNIIAQAVQAQMAAQQQQQQIQAIQARAAAQENEFKATAPDYDDAVNFVMAKRDEQLKIAGIADAGERYRVIQHEGLQLAAMAQQQGRNPAAIVYEMAKAFGHTATPAAAGNGNDNTAQGGAPAANADGGDHIRQVQAGQEQSRSLGAVRGAAPAAISAQRLIAMSDSEFSAALDKASPDKLREMFGA